MDTFWAGLLGAVVGGLFTLLGAWWQGRFALKAAIRQVQLAAVGQAGLSAYLDLLHVLSSAWYRRNSAKAIHQVSIQIDSLLIAYRPAIDARTYDLGEKVVGILDVSQPGDDNDLLWSALGDLIAHIQAQIRTLLHGRSSEVDSH